MLKLIWRLWKRWNQTPLDVAIELIEQITAFGLSKTLFVHPDFPHYLIRLDTESVVFEKDAAGFNCGMQVGSLIGFLAHTGRFDLYLKATGVPPYRSYMIVSKRSGAMQITAVAAALGVSIATASWLFHCESYNKVQPLDQEPIQMEPRTVIERLKFIRGTMR